MTLIELLVAQTTINRARGILRTMDWVRPDSASHDMRPVIHLQQATCGRVQSVYDGRIFYQRIQKREGRWKLEPFPRSLVTTVTPDDLVGEDVLALLKYIYKNQP